MFILCLMRLILHPFLPLPPVNLAWECGASSRCRGVFPPQSKTVFKAPFADQHTELHITSPRPTLPCFSLWASVFFPFVGLLSQPIETVTTITHPPKGLQAYSPKSSLRPLTRAIICLWVAGVAHSAPTEQKRARPRLARMGYTYLNTSHQDTLSEGPNRKTLNSSSPPLRILVAK